MTAPIASGWSESPGGACTHWKAPPFHGARRKRPFGCPAANGLSRIQTGPLTRPAGIYIDALLTSYRGDPWKRGGCLNGNYVICFELRKLQLSGILARGSPACFTGCAISRRSRRRVVRLAPEWHNKALTLRLLLR